MKIRNKYEQYGVEQFYKTVENYQNPHEPQIQELLKHFFNRNSFKENTLILDLGAGTGQVTKVLKRLGYYNIVGCDPYLYQAYEKETKQKCLKYSFEDIAENKLETKFDLVIASFSLHLAKESYLPNILWNLKTKELLVITPHKKPEIKDFFSLKEELLYNRVRLRHYKKDF